MNRLNRSEIWNLVEESRDDLVAFAQKLVQTPSLSGQEAEVAALIQAEMQRLDYDEVWVDKAGNVVGRLAGGGGPSLMFNGHMDHVDAGQAARWPHPPFGGEIHGGELWGRGAADMKGALAAMVYAGGLLKKLGGELPGDRYVSGVVQEEVGGLGARHLAQTLRPRRESSRTVDRAVIGEASANHLRRGHRGRLELRAHFEGRSVHASMPDLGVNPHFSLGRFLRRLRSVHMVADPDYGPSSVAPTRVVSEPKSANVTPAALDLTLDWRNIPAETTAEILTKLEAALARSLEPGCEGRIEVATKDLATYTGFRMSYPDTFPSFTTPAGHPWLVQAQAELAAALDRPVEVDVWRFATDGGHFAAAGAAVIGLGPGDDRVVHTVEERLPLDQLVESVVGYVALALT
ncbi:MAG: M20/M25/M40 family metallo-hydrolase [Anaerolineae bacterium]|jgi:putative selenium metabolism hydrolase